MLSCQNPTVFSLKIPLAAVALNFILWQGKFPYAAHFQNLSRVGVPVILHLQDFKIMPQ
jgi:hypothetical protein